MPHLLPFSSSHEVESDGAKELGDEVKSMEPQRLRKGSMLSRLPSLQKLGNWLKRDDSGGSPSHQWQPEGSPAKSVDSHDDGRRTRSMQGRRPPRPVVPELPRPQTFTRQRSEKRERLVPVEPTAVERRAQSEDRRHSQRKLPTSFQEPMPALPPSDWRTETAQGSLSKLLEADKTASHEEPSLIPHELESEPALGTQPPTLPHREPLVDPDAESPDPDPRVLQDELDSKWILNISMHFRDRSDREKFFIIYAQEPNLWRRVTVSCDYRKAQPGSLEEDLKSLHFQSDKSRRIYESIRESLPDIQFYPTVTNLKLETDDGRLHVHVTEDINEIVPYPDASLVEHIDCPRYREDQLEFQAHLSGFVYKVAVHDRILIKKEIPGPDTIDEFLYEINALEALQDAQSVIRLHGLVTDSSGEIIKGLLIAYASRGALVDVLYDHNKNAEPLSWDLREKWARQIVHGLSEIHEAGYVQGDFTLSNIVIDEHDDAKIIDINRRGCPMGWEPPELLRMIRSGQRISMCIGVKSDVYQLGMVLWALAEQEDEPERVERPLSRASEDAVPDWYGDIIQSCLEDDPRDRMSVNEMLRRFERNYISRSYEERPFGESRYEMATDRLHKVYIDPAAAVDLDDIDRYRGRSANTDRSRLTSGHATSAGFPPSTADYQYDSSGSYVVAERGRRPFARRDGKASPYARSLSSATSVSSNEREDSQWDHVHVRKNQQLDSRESSPARHPESQEERRISPPDEETPRSTEQPFEAAFAVPLQHMASNNKLPHFDHHHHSNTPPHEQHTTSSSAPHEQDTTQYHWNEEAHHFSPPLHQDSGFDEVMKESMIPNDDDDELPNISAMNLVMTDHL